MRRLNRKTLRNVQGAGNGNLPANEAFCTGGASNGKPFSNINFFVDPCTNVNHPMGPHA